MTCQHERRLPRNLEAAHLSSRALLRATELLKRIRAENQDLPFRIACRQALSQAWYESHAVLPNHRGPASQPTVAAFRGSREQSTR